MQVGKNIKKIRMDLLVYFKLLENSPIKVRVFVSCKVFLFQPSFSRLHFLFMHACRRLYV
jgi:hypothetical protein